MAEITEARIAEMETISRAEYEEFQAQRRKISELESRLDLLMEALRLTRHKQHEYTLDSIPEGIPVEQV